MTFEALIFERRLKRLLIVLLGAGMAFAAMAQGSRKGDNGGDVVVMEGHPIEFISKGDEIKFYILEDDGKSPTPTKATTTKSKKSGNQYSNPTLYSPGVQGPSTGGIGLGGGSGGGNGGNKHSGGGSGGNSGH